MKEKQVAIEAAQCAAQLCRKVQSEMVRADSLEKRDRSPVTVADFGSQALICRAIRAAFPDDVIVAEEDAQALQDDSAMLERVTHYVGQHAGGASSEQVCKWINAGQGEVGRRFWTLDPIDGTKGFLRGDQYAIALALVVDGEVVLGVLACPNLPWDIEQPEQARGCLFTAVRGSGTEMSALDGVDAQRVRVSHASPRFAESFESSHGDHAGHAQITQQLGITEPPLRLDSQAKYGLVARGDAAIYLRLPNPATPDYRECIWDHAAGMIVVEEAGGKVTDATGKALELTQGRRMTTNRGVVVTNGTLHSELLAAIREVTGTE